MKFRCYFSFLCILAIACVFMVGCEKMEKPVMDAMDMAMVDDTQQPETPSDMDDTDGETPADMDDTDGETSAEMDDGETPAEMDMDGETPAEMEPDATIAISPTEIALPEVGEQFTINISIDNKVPVAGYLFTLTFDAAVLKFVERSNSNYLSENEADIDVIFGVNDGSIEIGAVLISESVTGIGEGELDSVTFEVIEKQASTIVLSDVLVRDQVELLDSTLSADTVVIQ